MSPLQQLIPKEIDIHRTWILDVRPEHVEELEELLQEDGSDDEIEERSFNVLLPVARKMVCEYRDQIGGLDTSSSYVLGEPNISCVLCPGKKPFRGWEALIIHLKKYWKKRTRQHRAFLRALKEALRTEVETLRNEVGGDRSWPPVLIVNNSDGATFDGKLRRFKGLQGEEIPPNLADLKIHEVLAVYKKGGGDSQDSRIVVAYPASEVGFVDAKQIAKVREQDEPGPVTFETQGGQEDEADVLKKTFCGLVKREAATATSCGNKHWNLEEEDEEKDDKLCSLENLGLLPTMSELEQCEYLREKWSKSFETTKYTFQLPKAFKKSKKMQEMEEKFQKDLKELDHLNADGRHAMRLQLEEIEKQLNKERLHWLRNIDAVRKQFDCSVRDLCKQEVTRKLQKDVKLMNGVKEKLTSVNEDDRELSESQEKALEERLQSEKRRRFLIAKYQQEQVSLRKQAEQAKRERAHLMNVFQSSLQ